MRIILVSGLSGAGKSVVLNALEDIGYYCVDNLPASMLESFVSHTLRSGEPGPFQRTAIGIDARDGAIGMADVPRTLDQLRRSGLRCELLAVLADDGELLRRFGETKRRHPLDRPDRTLQQAVSLERELLDPVIQAADLVIDTTHLGVHQLREIVVRRIDTRRLAELSVTLVSFGFKHGVPGDCDFVFDARTLPNPYWDTALRPLTGRDPAVAAWLEARPEVARMLDDLERFIAARIEEHRAAHRRYLTIGIGCTGGQHRSVYIVDRLAERLAAQVPGIGRRHHSLDLPGRA
ncbi:MAG: RNase adapter RapZ [Gammaproteobacteria bacterium]|nr:RNase adapter RapZ [Gammaproteobacteria bacterium]